MNTDNYTYIVKVIKTDFESEEEEIFSTEYEAEPNESERNACKSALEIAYNGCREEN